MRPTLPRGTYSLLTIASIDASWRPHHFIYLSVSSSCHLGVNRFTRRFTKPIVPQQLFRSFRVSRTIRCRFIPDPIGTSSNSGDCRGS
jgi:hypothetical protein